MGLKISPKEGSEREKGEIWTVGEEGSIILLQHRLSPQEATVIIKREIAAESFGRQALTERWITDRSIKMLAEDIILAYNKSWSPYSLEFFDFQFRSISVKSAIKHFLDNGIVLPLVNRGYDNKFIADAGIQHGHILSAILDELWEASGGFNENAADQLKVSAKNSRE